LKTLKVNALNCGRQSATSMSVRKGIPDKPTLIPASTEQDEWEFKSLLVEEGFGTERSGLPN